MKLQTIELKTAEIVEENGEFVRKFSESKKYPLFLTNHAIKKGYEQGILDTSLYSDLVKVHQSSKIKQSDEEQAVGVINELDHQKMIAVIYLAFCGANKSQMTLDEFLEQYHLTQQETITTYLGLIGELFTGTDNAFVKALERDTKKDKKKRASNSKK